MPARRALFAAVLFALLAPSWALTASNWTLVWRDDFNGAKGSPPSPANWFHDVGQGRWGTGEIELMTNSTANSYLDGGGHLILTALRNQTGGWTSARLGTSHMRDLPQLMLLFAKETVRDDFAAPASGILRVQARIRLLANLAGNATQGYWPAFWMLGSTLRQGTAPWPACGEIDILETIDGQNLVHGTLHCGVSPGGPCHENSGLGGSAADTATAYHTYAMELDTTTSPQEIRWYLDSDNYWTVRASAVDPTTWAEATAHPFFIILDLAIGGPWAGDPTAQTQSGGRMELDYVAVFTSQ